MRALSSRVTLINAIGIANNICAYIWAAFCLREENTANTNTGGQYERK